jgi:nucleotide-binding universal stress UspA family protein
MFQEIPVHENNIFAYRVTGRLSRPDFQAFLPRIEELIARCGRISLFLELEGFRGWDLQAAQDDFRFGVQHRDDFERIALVGDAAWERWMALMARPFKKGEIRFFPLDHAQDAWDWLREGAHAAVAATPTPSPYRHILLATDFSPHAERAAYRALDLAERYQASLTFLHAVEETVLYDQFYDPIIPDRLKEDPRLQDTAVERLRKLLEQIGAPADCRQLVLSGSPRSVILGCAEAQQVDLIVAGRHGRGGLRQLLGSTANALVHRARCEVLAVPLEA